MQRQYFWYLISFAVKPGNPTMGIYVFWIAPGRIARGTGPQFPAGGKKSLIRSISGRLMIQCGKKQKFIKQISFMVTVIRKNPEKNFDTYIE
jgi:hypothetical protein